MDGGKHGVRVATGTPFDARHAPGVTRLRRLALVLVLGPTGLGCTSTSESPDDPVPAPTPPFDPTTLERQPLSDCAHTEELVGDPGDLVGLVDYECRDKALTGMVTRVGPKLEPEQVLGLSVAGMLEGMTVMSPWESVKRTAPDTSPPINPGEPFPFGQVVAQHATRGEHVGNLAVLFEGDVLHITLCLTPRPLFPERCAGMNEHLLDQTRRLAPKLGGAPTTP